MSVMTKEDMRGLFFVIKGQYKKDNSSDGVCVSGYDPYAPDTEEWYMVLDNTTFFCVSCGSNLKKVIRGVYNNIVKYKTRKNYFKQVCTITSEDYYEVHYLGQPPLTIEQRNAKMEGKCPRVSPAMKVLYTKIFREYGDFFDDLVREQEDLAYEALKGQTPFKKSKKLVKKTKTLNTAVVEEEKAPEKTPKKLVKKSHTEDTPMTTKVKPKVKLGVKRLTV